MCSGNLWVNFSKTLCAICSLFAIRARLVVERDSVKPLTLPLQVLINAVSNIVPAVFKICSLARTTATSGKFIKFFGADSNTLLLQLA